MGHLSLPLLSCSFDMELGAIHAVCGECWMPSTLRGWKANPFTLCNFQTSRQDESG